MKGGWSFSNGRSMCSRVSSALRTWASGGEIKPGKIEGKTQTASISVIVQYPLRHAAHGDDSLDAFRKGRSVAFCGQPAIESLSTHTDRFSQMAALLADEG